MREVKVYSITVVLLLHFNSNSSSMRRSLKWLLIIIVVNSVLRQCHAQDRAPDQKSWAAWAESVNVQTKVLVLGTLAASFRALNLKAREDSVVLLATELSSTEGMYGLEGAIHQWYADQSPHHNPRLARISVQALRRIADKYNYKLWQVYAYRLSARLDLDENQYQSALNEARQAFYILGLIDGPPREQCNTLLLLAECQEKVGDKTEAFRTYLEAKMLAERGGWIDLQSTALDRLSFFYYFIGDLDKARAYRQDQIDLDVNRNVDSAKQMLSQNFRAALLYRAGEWELARRTSDRVIAYAMRTHNDVLRDDAFGVLRTQLIDAGRVSELANVYLVQYPQELKRIQRENAFLHARIMALIAEAKVQPASERYWYTKADSLFPDSRKLVHQRIRFNQRYATFLMRDSAFEQARLKFISAYNASLELGYEPSAHDAAMMLDSLAKSLGDYQEAYQWSAAAKTSTDRQAKATEKDRLVQLQLLADEKAREDDLERKANETTRRHNLQFTAIAISIILAFIAVLLLRSAHVSARTLRVISFLSFILLFEFIILLADLFFHFLTHGEPWQMIILKLVFIAGLSQLHHWLEHKLAHYLASHEPLTELRRRVKSWWRKDAQHQTSTVSHPRAPVEPTESTDEIF